MPLKPCLDCGTLSQGPRCPTHQRTRDQARDRRRGSRQQRGLDTTYDRNRTLIMTNAMVCAICKLPGRPGDPLTCDHINKREDGVDNSLGNLRAVHASYNYSQGKGCRPDGAGRGPGGRGHSAGS